MATAAQTLEVPSKTKTINGIAFTISQPYAEGHVLNAIEAKVLNQTRSENIGNNLRTSLKTAQDEGKSEAELSAMVAELDAKYEFNLRTASESRKMDPYEKEAQNIARALVKDHLAKTGRKLTVAPEGTTKDEWDAKVTAQVDDIASRPNVIAAAKKQVDARKKSADALMESLGEVTV